MKPTDKITIETTLGDLAKVYAVLGRVNGSNFKNSLWIIAKYILDPEQKIYNSFFHDKSWNELRNYHDYQDEWIKKLFIQKSETEIEKQIKELLEKVEKLKTKI